MANKQPGQTDQIIIRKDDLLHEIVAAGDNVVDDVIGIRPGRLVLRAASTVSPANVIKSLTNLEKPSEFVETLSDKIESELSSQKGMPSMPSLPSLPKPF